MQAFAQPALDDQLVCNFRLKAPLKPPSLPAHYCPPSQSLERMTNAYVDKYMSQPQSGPMPATGTGSTFQHKTLSQDDMDAMLSRCVV